MCWCSWDWESSAETQAATDFWSACVGQFFYAQLTGTCDVSVINAQKTVNCAWDQFCKVLRTTESHRKKGCKRQRSLLFRQILKQQTQESFQQNGRAFQTRNVILLSLPRKFAEFHWSVYGKCFLGIENRERLFGRSWSGDPRKMSSLILVTLSNLARA